MESSGSKITIFAFVIALAGLFCIVASFFIPGPSHGGALIINTENATTRDGDLEAASFAGVRNGDRQRTPEVNKGETSAGDTLLVCDISTQAALQGAVIEVTGEGGATRKYTADARGTCVLSGRMGNNGLAAGDSLRVSHPGYFTALYTEGARPPRESNASRVCLSPLGKLSVRVRTPDGAPISGAFIQIFPSRISESYPPGWPRFRRSVPLDSSETDEPGNPARISETDHSGLFEIGDLPCHVPLHVKVSGECVSQWKKAIIDPLKKSLELEIVGAQAATVSGRVVDSAGVPVVNTYVRLWVADLSKSATPLFLAATDKNGAFYFKSIPLGQVAVKSLSSACPLLRVNIDRISYTLPDLVLQPSRRVKGRLLSKWPLGSTGRLRIVIIREGRIVDDIQPASDGLFELDVPEDVDRELEVLLGINYIRGFGDSFRITSRSVKPPVEMLEIDLDAHCGAIQGLIPPGVESQTSPEKKLVSPASVSLVLTKRSDRKPSLEASEATFTIEEARIINGLYSIGAVPTGEYEVTVLQDGKPIIWQDSITVQAGAVSVVNSSVRQTESVVGQVVNQTNDRVSTGTVTASSTFGRVTKTTIDSLGSFRFEQLEPGRWSFVAESGSNRTSIPEEVIINGAPRERPVILVVNPLASLTVYLKDRFGNSVGDVRTTLLRMDGKRKFIALNTDSTGAVVFKNLSPARYTFGCYEGPFGIRQEVDILEGENKSISIRESSEQVTVRLTRDRLAISDISNVYALTKSNEVFIARRVGTGEFRLPAVNQPVLLIAERIFMGPPRREDYWFAAFDGRPSNGIIDIPINTSGLIIALNREETLEDLPGLYLTDVDGFDVRLHSHSSIAPIHIIPERVDRKTLRVPGVVFPMTGTLKGYSSSGEPREIDIRVESSATKIIWPY